MRVVTPKWVEVRPEAIEGAEPDGDGPVRLLVQPADPVVIAEMLARLQRIGPPDPGRIVTTPAGEKFAIVDRGHRSAEGEVCVEHVTAWEGIRAEGGETFPCSAENRRLLFSQHAAPRQAVLAALGVPGSGGGGPGGSPGGSSSSSPIPASPARSDTSGKDQGATPDGAGTGAEAGPAATGPSA